MDAEQSFTAHCVTYRRNEAAATTASCGTARVAKYPDDGGLQGRPPQGEYREAHLFSGP